MVSTRVLRSHSRFVVCCLDNLHRQALALTGLWENIRWLWLKLICRCWIRCNLIPLLNLLILGLECLWIYCIWFGLQIIQLRLLLISFLLVTLNFCIFSIFRHRLRCFFVLFIFLWTGTLNFANLIHVFTRKVCLILLLIYDLILWRITIDSLQIKSFEKIYI